MQRIDSLCKNMIHIIKSPFKEFWRNLLGKNDFDFPGRRWLRYTPSHAKGSDGFSKEYGRRDSPKGRAGPGGINVTDIVTAYKYNLVNAVDYCGKKRYDKTIKTSWRGAQNGLKDTTDYHRGSEGGSGQG
jgi:hypothetical protein